MGDFPQDSIKSIRHLYRYLTNLIKNGTVTMENKTLESPVITDPDITQSIVTGIDTSEADVTLDDTQKKAAILVVSASNTSKAIIAPAENRAYWVVNGDVTNAVKIKCSGKTGVSIATGKTALVYFNGTDYAKLTADQAIA